ncbi:MAG: sporulation initiation factor Spo0A C-terminal domain-containing protein [Christensenella sp.]
MARFMRTLIVEQSSDYINQIKGMLWDVSDSFVCTTNGEEALALYDKYHPDLVLVEAILPGYDGFALMEHMLCDKDVIKIVLTSMSQEMIIRKSFELEAAYVIVKPYIKELFVKRILEAAELRMHLVGVDYDRFLIGRISVVLKRLGIPVNIKGYKFLKEALQMVCADPMKMRPLNLNVYEPLARKYNSTDKCVERNIRHAIETAASRGDPKAFEEYFGYSISSEKGKPTNGEFIAALAEKLMTNI